MEKVNIITIGELIELLSKFSSEDFIEGTWEGISQPIRGWEYNDKKHTLYLNVDTG